MTETAPVRIGFVGVGGMGQCAHLRNYAALPDCDVVAIAELRRNTAAKVAAKYGVPAVYDDAHEMIARERPDALVCSQPFQRHAALLPELLCHRKPIFIEKPLAGSLESGEKLLEAIENSGTWVMVGYHKRSDPATIYACDAIRKFRESGEIGAMRYVRILMPAGDWIAGGFWDYVDAGDSRKDLETEPVPSDMDAKGYAGYVSFVNYYIHQVNLLRHLLGESYEVTYADPSGVLLAAQSSGGVAAVIEMTPYQTTVDWQESALVAFERGYVKLELPAPVAVNRPGRVEILRDPGNGVTPEVMSPHLPWTHAMRRQAENFIAAVRGERPPMCDAREALEDLKVARAYLRLWKNV
ncbi:MAG TPA: Gfo/Idh/MocA family oxidoreductase [Candidatus Hydrogenedentes bacterium]|nr:Gfo/Idh/MocA family oxidoreductase [Candidatus Hydrogenedentota bacterium]